MLSEATRESGVRDRGIDQARLERFAWPNSRADVEAQDAAHDPRDRRVVAPGDLGEVTGEPAEPPG
jgi:hypothetical protein